MYPVLRRYRGGTHPGTAEIKPIQESWAMKEQTTPRVGYLRFLACCIFGVHELRVRQQALYYEGQPRDFFWLDVVNRVISLAALAVLALIPNHTLFASLELRQEWLGVLLSYATLWVSAMFVAAVIYSCSFRRHSFQASEEMPQDPWMFRQTVFNHLSIFITESAKDVISGHRTTVRYLYRYPLKGLYVWLHNVLVWVPMILLYIWGMFYDLDKPLPMLTLLLVFIAVRLALIALSLTAAAQHSRASYTVIHREYEKEPRARRLKIRRDGSAEE
jgi:hypothetical protein